VLVSKLRAAGVDPVAIRLALLAHHYRTDWEWTDADLSAAEARLARWRAAVSRPDGVPADSVVADLRARMADDLDAPGALAVIDAWVDRQEAADADPDAPRDTAAPGQITRAVDALLGLAL
jgi:L-cysteine:1D-myo-inositol 2-amino-2-deoxy-alpha-D-glucopyranoside ligase